MTAPLNPAHIMQIGMGFWASKTLLAAVEMDLYTALSEQAMTGAQIGDRLGLHPRALYDFLDALVSLDLLGREGNGHAATYHNTPETGAFLDKDSPMYIGGVLEMANARLYPFWGNLSTALQTGEPQNELAHGENLFAKIYEDELRLEQFLRAMQGFQMGNFLALAEKVDLSNYSSYCDVGGANGTLAAVMAKRYPNLSCSTFDLPPVKPIAERHVEAFGAPQVKVLAGNFLEDPIPQADVLSMGNVLHDWSDEEKAMLIKKAYDSVSDGGLLIVVENVIDDERRGNTFGLLMSLNMLIETPHGSDYTAGQFDVWAREAGFQRTEIIPLAGPTSAAIAYK